MQTWKVLNSCLVWVLVAHFLLISVNLKSASAQQSGLLYWCSLIEGGPNFESSSWDAPRSVWIEFLNSSRSGNDTAAQFSAPCHVALQPNGSVSLLESNFAQYTFSNGTSHPQNNVSSSFAVNPSSCNVADNWGTNPSQCLVPGYGSPEGLFMSGIFPPAPTSYPITFDQRNACEQTVYSSDLTDSNNETMVYGKLFAWKSNGNTLLYITVSINATGFGTTNDLQCNHCEKSKGQLLHASPSLFHPSSGPSGQLYIWNGEPKNWSLTQKSTILDNNVSTVRHGVSAVQQQQMFLGNYRSSEMLFWPIDALWSCFTYTVDLSSVCDPWESYGKGLFASGCTNRSDGLDASADSQQDLTDSQALYMAVSFNLTRFSLASSRNNQCGDFSNASVALRGDQVVAVLPGSGFVDLHNISSGQSLPRSCTVASPPTSVVIEEPPSSKGMPSQPPIMPPSEPYHPPPSSTIHNAPPTVPTSQPILFPVGSPDQSPLYPTPKPSLYSYQPLSPTPSSPSTPPPPSSPFFSVFMFNQSSRLYNESQDCFYLLGLDPSNVNAATHGLLGPYLSNVWNWECSTQSSKILEGSQLAWSALYLRLDFLQPFYNMLLAQIITSNLGSFWSDAALLPYPFGLAGPVGSSAPCSFFGMFFSTTVGSLIDPASATPGVVGASFPFYACSETLMDNVVPPQSPSPPIFAIPNGVNLFYPSGIRNSDILGSGPNTQIYPNQTCSIQLKAGLLCPPMSVSPSPPPAPHSPLLEDLPLIPFPPQHPPTYPPKPKVPSPPVLRSSPTCNISISFNKIYSAATNPFNLTSHESDGARLASLVNEIYTKGPTVTTASSVASPQYGIFTYLQPSVLLNGMEPTQADTVVLMGVMLADDAQQQQFLMISLEDPTKMIALAVLFHLSCTDEVWVNSSCSRPDSYLLFTSSPTIVLATLPTGTIYLPNTVLPCPQTPSPPQLLPPLIPASPLSSPRPHPIAVNPLLPSITPGPLLPQSLPPGPPPSPWSFIAFYNEAYLSCESSEIALEEALKGLCGPNPPVSLSCTDVLNGLVIQLIFLRPVDLDVFYATLTSVNGMGYLIYTSMLSGSLPCGTHIMASSSLVSAVANFSCNSSSASSLSEVTSKLCCSSPSPPPPLLPPTIPPFLPSSPPSAPTVPPLTPPSSPFHDLPSPPRLPQSTSPYSSSPLLRSPLSNITLPVSYQMLISFPLDVGNTNVNKQSVTQEVCPALLGLLSNLLQDQGLSPFTTLYGSIHANGCYAVSILPSPVAPIRIQATFYFNVTAPQWSSLTAALYSINTITRGHILCYSTLILKPYGSVSASEAAKSTLMMTPTANPGWLGTPAEAAGTCFTSLRPASPQKAAIN